MATHLFFCSFSISFPCISNKLVDFFPSQNNNHSVLPLHYPNSVFISSVFIRPDLIILIYASTKLGGNYERFTHLGYFFIHHDFSE